jgi:hypothetical protein
MPQTVFRYYAVFWEISYDYDSDSFKERTWVSIHVLLWAPNAVVKWLILLFRIQEVPG